MAGSRKPVSKGKKFSNTAKVSPLRGTSVDDYVARLSSEQADIVSALRALIRKAAPNAIESIKWAMPHYEDNGSFAYIKPNKNHITFGFWRGAELADRKGLLQGDSERMKHLKVVSVESIDTAAFTAFVMAAVKLNHEKPKPTKR